MLSGLVLSTSPSPILMQFSTRVTLVPNREVQNISAMPAIISTLEELYFLPRIDKKSY